MPNCPIFRYLLTSLLFKWLHHSNIFVYCLFFLFFFFLPLIDTIAAGGKVNAPTPQRVFWCTFEGLVAIRTDSWGWFDRLASDGSLCRFTIYHRAPDELCGVGERAQFLNLESIV